MTYTAGCNPLTEIAEVVAQLVVAAAVPDEIVACRKIVDIFEPLIVHRDLRLKGGHGWVFRHEPLDDRFWRAK